jgi:hypothetical protein
VISSTFVSSSEIVVNYRTTVAILRTSMTRTDWHDFGKVITDVAVIFYLWVWYESGSMERVPESSAPTSMETAEALAIDYFLRPLGVHHRVVRAPDAL